MQASVARATYFGIVTAVLMSPVSLGVASAQTSSLPGLIVTVPPSSSPEPEKTAPKEPKKPAVTRRKPQAKPRPKSARRPPKRAPTGRGPGSGRRSPHKIVLLVNDDPITNYEIDERAKLLAMRVNVTDRAKKAFASLIRNPKVNARLKSIFQEVLQANRGKSRDEIIAIFDRRKRAYAQSLQKRALSSARGSVLPGLRKKAESELIEERLKLQAAKRLNIKIDNARVESIFAGVAKNNKLTAKQFAARIRSTGVNPAAMKARFRANAAWSMVVSRRFSRLVSVNARQVDEFLGEQPSQSSERLKLHKITFRVPKSLDQKTMTQRFQTAEDLRRRFKGCSSTASLVSGVPGAQFKDLGGVDSNKIAEPTRSMVLAANTNEMLPPSVERSGIVLYAVCGKTVSNRDPKRMRQARQTLQQKELGILARRHLADLKRDAHIERR
ncbi:MAG: SurA N-terminal domain-containing protein [Pseudomonadota bacterium]